MLSFIQWLLGLIAQVPTVILWFDPPKYSLLPQAWLRLHETTVPPLVSRLGVENFGTRVAEGIRIKLNGLMPDYPIEPHDIAAKHWRLTEEGDIEIDRLDPQGTATFLLYFDSPQDEAKPLLICGDRLVGARSRWLWGMYSAPWKLVAIPLLAMVIALVSTGYLLNLVYQERWSPQAREGEQLFNQYYKSRGYLNCLRHDLTADGGTLNERQLRKHTAGEADLLRLNKATSLSELLKKSWVMIVVCPEAGQASGVGL